MKFDFENKIVEIVNCSCCKRQIKPKKCIGVPFVDENDNCIIIDYCKACYSNEFEHSGKVIY
jgi:hypothetical protein